MRRIVVALCLVLAVTADASGSRTTTASRVARNAVRGCLRPERPGAEQRRRAARRHQPRGAFQQRVPVGLPSRQHRAHQPAHCRAAAVARIRVHLQVRFRDRHFVRSTNSFGPILSDRAETIGRGRLAFGFSHQFFSFDHLDGVRLTAVPAVFRHDGFETGGGRADVVSTTNTIEATVSQFTGALTYGITDRVDVSLAVPVVRTRLSLLSNARSTGSARVRTSESTTFGTIWPSAATDRRISTSSKDRRAASATCSCARRRP